MSAHKSFYCPVTPREPDAKGRNVFMRNTFKMENQGVLWRSSGQYSALPLQGAQVGSLVGELKSTSNATWPKKKKGKEKQNQGHISATSALTSPQLHLLTFTPETFTPQGLYNWAAVSGISLQQCWLEKEQRSCTEDEVLGRLEL